MQNAKDTFYEVLRDRVAAGNAARTVVVRGVVRPGVVVEENEIVDAAALRDCFVLRWTDLVLEGDGVARATCEIAYETTGSLDRGRKLSAMDRELRVAVGASAQNAAKRDFSALASGGAVSETGDRIWWSDVVFGAVKATVGVLRRTAIVSVWSCEEAGGA